MKPVNTDLLISQAMETSGKKTKHKDKIIVAPMKEIAPGALGGEIMSERDGDKSKRIRLLLVDDEEAYVNVLSNRMAKRNIDVTKALSGTDAIQALRKKDFDVSVLDLKMEDMDGIEVLKVFKKMVPRMPVIMLTGHGSEQAAREGIRHGAFDYLTKPCELEELIQKIKEAPTRRGGS